MKSQKDIFRATEADQWFNRNKESYKKTEIEKDIIIQTLKEIEISPKRVLEVGCANGAKLNKLYQAFGSECVGIDPSSQAIEQGKIEFPELSLHVATADSLPFEDEKFDLIVFGFCLYLCDRADLFKIALEANRCLSDRGHLAIVDFEPPFPYKNTYAHLEGIYCYKMDYSKLFSWNPAYNQIYKNVFSHSGYAMRDIPNEKVSLTILSKTEEFAYPTNPFG